MSFVISFGILCLWKMIGHNNTVCILPTHLPWRMHKWTTPCIIVNTEVINKLWEYYCFCSTNYIKNYVFNITIHHYWNLTKHYPDMHYYPFWGSKLMYNVKLARGYNAEINEYYDHSLYQPHLHWPVLLCSVA